MRGRPPRALLLPDANSRSRRASTCAGLRRRTIGCGGYARKPTLDDVGAGSVGVAPTRTSGLPATREDLGESGAAFGLGLGSVARRGTSNHTVTPSAWPSAPTEPPWAATNSLTIASPMPAPPLPRARLGSAR